MRRMVMIVLVCVAGCEPDGKVKVVTPCIVATSDEALEESLDKINLSLSESDRKVFAADCSTILAPELMKAVYRNSFDRSGGGSRAKSVLYKPFQGLNAREIHSLALGYKANDERLVAEAKAMKDAAEAMALTRNHESIAQFGTAAMKRHVAEQFGEAYARQARVLPENDGVKEDGDRAWVVTGSYDGPDKEGVRFMAPWTAKLALVENALRCLSVKFGEVTWKNVPTVKSFAAIINPSAPPAKGTGGRGAVTAPPSGQMSKSNGKPAKPKSKDERAAEALAAGKAQLEAGQRDKALGFFEGVVRDYPKTPAAVEARELLDFMTGRSKKK